MIPIDDSSDEGSIQGPIQVLMQGESSKELYSDQQNKETDDKKDWKSERTKFVE